MITLTQIRELVLKQEKELEKLIIEYISQSKENFNETIISKDYIKCEVEKEIENGNFDRARDLIDDNINLLEGDASLYSIRGTIALYENNLEEALDNFLIGLEIDKNNADILYNMGYLNTLLGNNEEAIYFYNKCLQITDDEDLRNELYSLLDNLDTYKPYTLIALDFDKDDKIFNSLDKEKNNIVNIVLKKDIEFENKYYENGMTFCEVSSSKYLEMINYFIRRNENCVVIYRKLENKKLVEEIKDSVGTIYFPTKNYYTDESNYLNHNIDMNDEKDICNLSNLIVTDDINIYNYKKIIEKRNNVYLIDETVDKYLSIDNLLGNLEGIDNEKINKYIKEYGKSLEDEYIKALYIIASEIGNESNCLELSKYIYEKYNTKESYHLYINLLKTLGEYNNIVSCIMSSKYCEDIYKSEIVYLNAISNFELIDFVVDIITKNYKMVELTSDKYSEYKMALYSFELNLFDTSYEKYINVIKEDDALCNSPLVNRNIGYLMYAMGNDNYEKHYNLYKELVEDFLS